MWIKLEIQQPKASLLSTTTTKTKNNILKDNNTHMKIVSHSYRSHIKCCLTLHLFFVNLSFFNINFVVFIIIIFCWYLFWNLKPVCLIDISFLNYFYLFFFITCSSNRSYFIIFLIWIYFFLFKYLIYDHYIYLDD